jgi:hypothetical protein
VPSKLDGSGNTNSTPAPKVQAFNSQQKNKSMDVKGEITKTLKVSVDES